MSFHIDIDTYKIRPDTERIENQTEKFLFWYSFLMAFPIIVPIFNVSIYIFPFLLYSFKKRYGFVFRWKGVAPGILLWLVIGLIINVSHVLSFNDSDSVNRTLQVAPNYFYWFLLIWFLYSQRENLTLHIIGNAIFWGLIGTTLFYFFLSPLKLHTYIPIIKNLSQNNYAFLIITYTPVAIRYSKQRFGSVYSLFFLLIMVVSGFLSGSRSSSVLVLVGGIVSLYMDSFHRQRVVRLGLTGLLFYGLFQISYVENLISDLNPRTHDLLYETSNVLKTDRSYLVRRLQIEKGIAIFAKKPFTGIGLNNYSEYEDVKLLGDFEGAKYVINKRGITEKSSHNSYINLLAEGGLALFVPFGLLILYVFILLFKTYKELDSTEIAFVIGFIMMLIHLYFITALVNVFCWFMIGVVLAMLKAKSEKVISYGDY